MNNNLNKAIAITIVLFIICYKVEAQFKVEAQLRSRLELRDGYQKLAPEGSTPAAFISQRSRLNFNFAAEKLKFKLSMQDVRVWGDDANFSFSGNNGNDASIDLYEGYAEIGLGTAGWLSVGRQELVYDNQSILSNANWNQNGITSDALVLKLKAGEWNLHLVGSWNSLKQLSANNTYDTLRYKSLNFIWLNRKFSENLSLSLMHIAAGVTETDSTNQINFGQTSGFHLNYKKDNLNFWADAYYQFGKNRSGIKRSAFLIDAEMNYKIKMLTTAIGYAYLSGNSKTGEDMSVDNLFEGIYRSRHTYFGYLDYFTVYNTQTKQGGVADYNFYLDYKISESVNIRNIGHYFQLAQTNSESPDEKNLGFENDLVLKYRFNDWGTLECGYLFYLPTESLETIQKVPNSKFSQFLYLQLTLTPTLFKQKEEKL